MYVLWERIDYLHAPANSQSIENAIRRQIRLSRDKMISYNMWNKELTFAHFYDMWHKKNMVFLRNVGWGDYTHLYEVKRRLCVRLQIVTEIAYALFYTLWLVTQSDCALFWHKVVSQALMHTFAKCKIRHNMLSLTKIWQK